MALCVIFSTYFATTATHRFAKLTESLISESSYFESKLLELKEEEQRKRNKVRMVRCWHVRWRCMSYFYLIFDTRTSESLISAALTLEPNYWIYELEVRRNAEGKGKRKTGADRARTYNRPIMGTMRSHWSTEAWCVEGSKVMKKNLI